MALEEIISDIKRDASVKVSKIIDDAKSKAEAIKAGADSEARRLMDDARRRGAIDAGQMLARETSRANIDAKAIYQSAIDAALEKSFAALNAWLKDFKGTDAYTKLLNKLAALALSELGQGCIISLQSEDLKKVVAEKLQGAKVEAAKEKFGGGLRGVSGDGSMYIDYSMEKIMEAVRGSISVKLLKTIEG